MMDNAYKKSLAVCVFVGKTSVLDPRHSSVAADKLLRERGSPLHPALFLLGILLALDLVHFRSSKLVYRDPQVSVAKKWDCMIAKLGADFDSGPCLVESR